MFTFNWTDLRIGDLVGFNGEDRNIDGVEHEGNLTRVSGRFIAGPEGYVPLYPGRWVATDIFGNRFVFFADHER